MSHAFGYSLDEYLFFGGYPGASRWVDDIRAWREYVVGSVVTPTIDHDVLALAPVDHPMLLRQIVGLLPDTSGRDVTNSKLAEMLDFEGRTQVIDDYLYLLTEAGLAMELPHFAPHTVAWEEGHPRHLALDPSLMTAVSGFTFEKAAAHREFRGRVVKIAIGAHLHNTMPIGGKVTYWREGEYEIAFILRMGPKVLGMEVGDTSPNSEGFRAFRTAVS